MPYLRQSTTQTIRFGPCLDKTDGVSEETALTLVQADMRLSKDGGAFAQKSAAGNATHDSDGWYSTALSTTDTDTVGELILNVHQPANMLPVWLRWWVLEEAVYDAIYGAAAAGPLQSTVAGRTLDVSAGGEAGIDWANVGTPGSTVALADTTIGLLAGATSAQLVDDVWDEVLTGATHNVPTSAGRRLRALNDFGLYEGGAVWYDDVHGSAGAVDFENGTVNNPCSAEADVVTLLASIGLTRVHCKSGSTYVLASTYNNFVFEGENWTLQLASQDVAGTTFIGAAVSGIATGTGTTQQFKHCLMGATSIIKGTHYITCGLSGTQTLGEAGDYFYDRCHSAVAGTATPVIDFGAALNASNLSVRNYSGGIEIQNMGAGSGSYSMSLEGRGQLVIAASCSATSTVAIRGHFTVTDNAGGVVTLSDDARIDVAQVEAEVNDALVALGLDHLVAVAVVGADVVDDSIIAQLVSKSATADWDSYVNTTDSLEALRDRGDAAWITGSAPTAVVIADAVWDEARAGHVAAGSFGEGVIVETNSDKTGYAIAVGGIAATSFAAGAINAAATSTDFINEIWAKICEDQGNYTALQILSILFSACAGVTAAATFKTPNGVSSRITATLNASEERTAITLNPSAGA